MGSTKIPASIEDATELLNGLGALLTAKQWERAAIVYAFTRDGEDADSNPKRRSEITTPLLPREFAKLGITGLASDQTVRAYRKAWQGAINAEEAKASRPGHQCRLPDIPWPPMGHSTGAKTRFSKDATPEDKAKVVANILKDPDVRKAMDDAANEEARERERERQRKRKDYEATYDPSMRRIEEGAERAVVTHNLAKVLGLLGESISLMPKCGQGFDLQADINEIRGRLDWLETLSLGGGVDEIESFANKEA